MQLPQTYWGFTTEAWRSFMKTVDSARWVITMYSKRGLRYMRAALLVYVIANIIEQLAIYFGGQLLAGHHEQTSSQALFWMLLIIASWLISIGLQKIGDRIREWGWNLNDRVLYQKITRGWMRKSPGEMMAEDRTVGPYQIESSASSMHEYQFVIFFHLMEVAVTVAVITGFMLYVDLLLGVSIIGVLLGNLIGIFYFNHYIHKRARVIDKDMRALRNRLIEFLLNSVYVVGTGNERAVLRWLKRAQLQPYLADYKLFGVWLPVVEGLLSAVTHVCLGLIIWFGYERLETAEFIAVFGWMLVYRRQLMQFASIQRNLARDAEKIHALREELETKPAMEQGAFAPIKGNTDAN